MSTEKREKKLQIYLTNEEYGLVEKLAAEDNREKGEWARLELEKILKKNGSQTRRVFQLVEV